MERFAKEITELRALGFAEGLSIHSSDPAGDVIARLESGRIGVAVEFRVDESAPRYAVKPLVPEAAKELPVATDVWSDVVQDVRRRAPLPDDE